MENMEEKCLIDLGDTNDALSQISATIFVTDRCNLACTYCYEADKEFTDIDVSHIDKFLELLFTDERYCKRKKIILDFIGGEPFTVPHIMSYAIDKFFEIGRKLKHHWIKCGNYIIFASTNGTLFDKPEVKEFLQKYPFFIPGVSLDGCKEAHDKNRKYLNGDGSYDKIMENFEWWKERYQQPTVKGTLSPNNLELLSKMLINQIELGITQIWANPIFEHKWTKEEADIYIEQYKTVIEYIIANKLEYVITSTVFQKDIRIVEKMKKEKAATCDGGVGMNWCGTCKFMISLGLDGKLYPCHRFSTSKEPYRYDIGDLNTGLDISKVNNLMRATVKMNCPDCEIMEQCPMCYASYYEISKGDSTNPKNICEMVKAEFKIADYYRKRLLEEVMKI